MHNKMQDVVASRRRITTALLNVLPAAIDALHRWLEFPRINSKPPLLLMTDATWRNVDLDQNLQSHLSGRGSQQCCILIGFWRKVCEEASSASKADPQMEPLLPQRCTYQFLTRPHNELPELGDREMRIKFSAGINWLRPGGS